MSCSLFCKRKQQLHVSDVSNYIDKISEIKDVNALTELICPCRTLSYFWFRYWTWKTNVTSKQLKTVLYHFVPIYNCKQRIACRSPFPGIAFPATFNLPVARKNYKLKSKWLLENSDLVFNMPSGRSIWTLTMIFRRRSSATYSGSATYSLKPNSTYHCSLKVSLIENVFFGFVVPVSHYIFFHCLECCE